MDPDMPDALQPDAGLPLVRGGVPPAAVTVFGEDNSVEVPDTLEARVPRLLASPHAPEERLKRLV